MKKKEITEMVVIKMKRELLFNYDFYPNLGHIQSLYHRRIEEYPDSKKYQNMKKSVFDSLYSELCTEKSSKILFEENEDCTNYDHLINLLEERKKFL